MRNESKKNKAEAVLLFILAVVFIALMRPPLSYNDSDAFWHIKIGQWMIEHKQIAATGVFSFPKDDMPYVPHEAGFQLAVGFLYNAWGWKGVYLLTAACAGFLIYGVNQLMKEAREDENRKEYNPLLFFVSLIYAFAVYISYFTTRPQMVSAVIIIWFMVLLRRFQRKPDYKKVFLIFLLSLALSNIHAGVWLAIFVFYAMALIESACKKSFGAMHAVGLAALLLGGALNAGGIKSLLYIKVVSVPYSNLIAEWNPINIHENWLFFITTALFMYSVSASFVKRNLFNMMLAVGILYLGLNSAKQHLFLMLFTPYFLATTLETASLADGIKKMGYVGKKFMAGSVLAGLAVNIASSWLIPYEQPKTAYPVEEMNYILKDSKAETPKVMSTYDTSGYVMFRGAKVLADGRFDPFIGEGTKGVNGWVAYQQSYYAYEGFRTGDIIKSVSPDYVIMPKLGEPKTAQSFQLQTEIDKMGKADFKGSYGSVWKIRH